MAEQEVLKMTKEQLCTQYELIISMLKKGDAEDVIEILENAVKRIDNETSDE